MSFVVCEKCKKRLIERLPNGLWRFRFGKRPGKENAIVEMLIHGSLKIRCFRDYCGHINTLNYLPNIDDFQSPQSEASQPDQAEKSPSK